MSKLYDFDFFFQQHNNKEKDIVCSAENFIKNDLIESRHIEKKPARILVQDMHSHAVNCDLPERFKNGFIFR